MQKCITCKNELTLHYGDEVYGENFEEPKIRVPDISKINKATGWVPKKGLDEIIIELANYFGKI